MGLTAKNNRSSEGWGMGFFLVFFPEEEEQEEDGGGGAAVINHRKNKITTINTLLRRTNSNDISTKAQSTISICALLIFITLLLFTLSTFEPNTNSSTATATATHLTIPRRQLSSKSFFNPTNSQKPTTNLHALQGMGTLYARGTRAMNDLIICHAVESLTVNDLQLFLRLFHRSGLPSRSDLLFIFPSKSTSFDSAIRQENDSFFKLVHQYANTYFYGNKSLDSAVSFDMTQFVKPSKKEVERAEPIWGRRIKSNSSGDSEAELTRPSYGSILSFDAGELDPENSLAGFLDHVPMSLRRWACYPMLLGRVRRNFKHVMLIDMKEVLLLGDPLSRVRNRSPETVTLSTTAANKHGRTKNSDKAHQKPATPAVLMGGARGIRRLSSAMLTEIVRATMQHNKRKNPVTELALLNQLVGNEFLVKNTNINLAASTESIPEASQLNGLKPGSSSSHTIVRRGNSNTDIDATIMKHICSFPLDSLFYSNC